MAVFDRPVAAFRNPVQSAELKVTSVEFFDKNGELAASFSGVREHNKPQPQTWTDMTAALN